MIGWQVEQETRLGIRAGQGVHRRRMFITVYTYRARPQDAEATISLHLEIGRHPAWRGPGFLSCELLRSLEDPQEFVEVTRFEDERSARETTRKPEYISWQRRLLETLENGPSFSHFHRVLENRASLGASSIETGPRREGGGRSQ